MKPFILFSWLLLPFTPAPRRAAFLPWRGLRNPVLSYPHWSIKDSAMAWRKGRFYIFFSAFYQDRGEVRSHVVEVSTRDFRHYSRPILDFDGAHAGWEGMCSPDVRRAGGGRYELTFNSWGDQPGRFNQLFYRTSSDLRRWSPRHPLAANLTRGRRTIDAAVAYNGRRYYLIWKQSWKHMRPRLASAQRLRGPWKFVGNGLPRLLMANGRDDGLTHENFTFARIGGRWRLLASDYGHGQRFQTLYTQARRGDWLDWGRGYHLRLVRQSFNHRADDAGAIDYWRRHDGYVYLIYAGRNDIRSYRHRGWNRLGLSRSRDLRHWSPAGH